jgi:peroxiredoxin
LRQDYAAFVQRGAEIIALGPDGPNAFRRYWENEKLPFIGLADVGSRVADRYYQEVNLLKLGRMPAVFVIDRPGQIRYLHYGRSMQDIPPNEDLLGVLEALAAEQTRGD